MSKFKVKFLKLTQFLAIVTLALMSALGYGAVTFVHTDHLGSVVAESNSSGSITKRFHYKPFGETIEAQQDDVGYTGHKHDVDIGLTYMQARYYDPVLGRFLSNDPASYLEHLQRGNPVQGFNRYAYANNNPYKYNDPDGRFINFAVKFAADVALGVAIQAATGQKINVGAALKDSAQGILNPAKSVQKAQKLYRALSKNDDIAKGLTARNPLANATPAQHVNGKKDSQFISTTKDKNTALEKYNSGNGVVEIDLSKVNGKATDVSGGIPGASQKVNNFAKKIRKC